MTAGELKAFLVQVPDDAVVVVKSDRTPNFRRLSRVGNSNRINDKTQFRGVSTHHFSANGRWSGPSHEMIKQHEQQVIQQVPTVELE